MTLKNIVWLASYPKSGNTWARAFLINYLLNAQQPIPINQIHRLGMGDAIAKSYQMVSNGLLDPADYRKSVALRPKVLRGIASNDADLNFVKSHNANSEAFGVTLIPRDLTRSAIYIVRNPLDMAVSYSRHYGNSIETTIDAIGRSDHTISGDAKNVEQFLGSWSTHVRSWVDCPDFPVSVIRYEDMLDDPETAFATLLDAISIPVETERLKRAIRHASFEELSKQEKQTGFIERSDNTETFFHTGKASQWETAMTSHQADQIRTQHRQMMIRFGYL